MFFQLNTGFPFRLPRFPLGFPSVFFEALPSKVKPIPPLAALFSVFDGHDFLLCPGTRPATKHSFQRLVLYIAKLRGPYRLLRRGFRAVLRFSGVSGAVRPPARL